MHVDAVDGFGGWSVELEFALTSYELRPGEKVQRTVKRYDGDGRGKYIGLLWRGKRSLYKRTDVE